MQYNKSNSSETFSGKTKVMFMVKKKIIKSGFRELAGHGFQITLKNGYTISVIFGFGTYSDNRDKPMQLMFKHAERLESTNAEIAVLKPNGKFLKMDKYDLVVGWQSVDDFLKLVKKIEEMR